VKTLKIDDKFSIVYDDENNDRPLYVERHGSRHANLDVTGTPNWVISMFYALLETEQRHEDANAGNIEINTLLINGEL